jgi:hypothetical protein
MKQIKTKASLMLLIILFFLGLIILIIEFTTESYYIPIIHYWFNLKIITGMIFCLAGISLLLNKK